MLNRSVLSLLIVAVAVLASPGLAAPVDAQTTIIVDDDFVNCVDGLSPDWHTISFAVADASPGDTIHVCPGDYTEPSMSIYDNELTIEGSGASVTHVHHSGAGNGLLIIYADYVVVEFLDLEAPGTHAIISWGNSISIENNEFRNAYAAVGAWGSNVGVLSNSIHDTETGIGCWGDGCVVSGNTIQAVRGIGSYGNGGVVTDNVVHGTVSAGGDDQLVANNQISGPGAAGYPLMDLYGHVTVTDNALNTWDKGIIAQPIADPGHALSASITIARNTFDQVDAPILLLDTDPGDAFTMTATIGGSASEANTFIDSGGSLGDSNYLVQMDGVTFDVDAEYNKWGLCTATEIEREIYDKADDPVLGAVDFEPFIAPGSCSATPTPTATPTRTPTPTPTATPKPGPTRTVTIPPGSWANFTWTGDSSPQTVADCFGAGKVAVMYRLDAASGSFQRWIGGRDDLSNMGDVQRFDALLALNVGAQPATCTMPDDVVPYSFTIPAGRWANFAWLANSFPAEVAPEACSEGSIAVIYRLDALTRTFQRWIRGRPELSNMTDVQPYDALLALNASGQPSTCTFTHYGQLAATSS